MDFLERYVTTRLYRYIFCPPTADDEDADLMLQDKIRSLHWINPYILDAQLTLGDGGNSHIQALVDKSIEGKLTALNHNSSIFGSSTT